jgi:hypothetical protein
MSTGRTDGNTRVRLTTTKEIGTVSQDPFRRHGTVWPAFDLAGRWVVPVKLDARGTVLMPVSMLEPYTDPEPEPDTAAEDRKKLAGLVSLELGEVLNVAARLRNLRNALEKGEL